MINTTVPRIAVLACIAWCLLTAAPAGQTGPRLAPAGEEATFSAANRTVAVYATVTDGAGRLVTSLDRSVFAVSDNGRRQPLTIFANDLQPITVVMLLDRSGSMRANFRVVEDAAEEFVKQLRPDDKARIGSFADRIQIDPREFSSDQDELTRIIRTELQSEGPTPLWNAVNVGITSLLRQQGRRVILVFTDGVDSPIEGSVNVSLKDVMKRAEQENVMVYAVGLAGNNFAPPGGFTGIWGGRRSGGYGRFGGWRIGRGHDGKPDDGLPKIAAATGGGYFELTSTADLGATFTRVAEELHHQYVLGFTPAKLDGKTHALRVELTQPGLSARARKSYVAMK
jgi:VWFA-related protein